MTYDNNSTPSGILWAPTKAEADWATRAGTSQRETPYSSLDLDASVSEQDQIVVVRTFPIASITPTPATPFTGEQVWKLWTLPNASSSGSAMYTLTGDKTVLMSNTVADYKFEIDGVEYTTPTFDYASHDTYILRRTYSKEGFVNWTAGSRITSAQLNHSMQQVINLLQEGIIRDLNRDKFDPFINQANGVAGLDSDGMIPNSVIGASTLGINTGNGITGDGTTGTPLSIDLTGSSGLEFIAGQLNLDVVTGLTSSSDSRALAASQGKELKAQIDTLGTGIAYKGVIDVAGDSAVNDSPSAGDTINASATVASGSIHASWTGLAEDITAGDLIRYSGAAWQKVSGGGTAILENGSVPLNAIQTATTQDAADSDTSVATTAFVHAVADLVELAELADVSISDVAAGSVLTSNADGSSWTIDNTVQRNVAGATNIKLENLADVPTSPTTNEYLKYNGSTWESAGVSVTNLVVGVTASTAGDHDGSNDVSDNVQDAWVNANLGHTGTPASTTLRVLEFNGAKHLLGDPTTFAITAANRLYTTYKQDVTYRNGHLQWKGIDTIGGSATSEALYPYMIAPTDRTGAASDASNDAYLQTIPATVNAANGASQYLTQSITNLMNPGETLLTVATTASMAAGRVIKISPTDTSTNTDYLRDDDAAGSNRMWFTMTNRIKKVISGTQIELETPIPMTLSSNKYKVTLNLYHATDADQTAANSSQPSRLRFEDMTFENLCSRYYHLGNNPLDFPDTANGSFVCTLPQDHDFPADKEVLASFDSISLQGGTDSIFYWGDINRMTKDSTATGTYGEGKLVNKTVSPVTGSLGDKELGGVLGNVGGSTATPLSTGSLGGALGIVGIGYERGIRINDGQDIVFKNCKFDGWAEAVILDSCYNVTFEDCTFNSPLWTGTGPNSTAIKLIGCTNVVVKNCTFNGAHYGIKNIDTVYSCYNVKLQDCVFNNVCSAIYLTGFNKDISIRDCDIVARAWNQRRLAVSRGIDNSSYAIHIEGYGIRVSSNNVGGDQTGKAGGSSREAWEATKYGRTAVTNYFEVAGGFESSNLTETSQTIGTSKGVRFVLVGKGLYGGSNNHRGTNGRDLSVNNNSIRGWEDTILVEARGGTYASQKPVNSIDISHNNLVFNRRGILISYGFDSCKSVNWVNISDNTIRSDGAEATNIPAGLSSDRNIFAYRYGEITTAGLSYGGIGSDHDDARFGNDMGLLGSQIAIRMGAAKDPASGASPTNMMSHVDIKSNSIDLISQRNTHDLFYKFGLCEALSCQTDDKVRYLYVAHNNSFGGYSFWTVAPAANVDTPVGRRMTSFHNMSSNQEYSYPIHRYTTFDYDSQKFRHEGIPDTQIS